MSVEIPKCAIAFGSVAPPQGDVIDLSVHLGCTKEVSSFECLLQNWNKKYSPGGTSPITVGLDGHIDIGRGTNVPQIITLRVESIKCESTPNENYIRISGRCWGEKLFRRVVTKTYDNKKGEEIVKDLLDYYVGLSHVRDSTELVENTDTTYTHLEYENTPVWDIIKNIAESSDLAGVIGFDFRVAPDGKFEFFPKNSKTSSVSLSEKIEVSEYRKDILRIRNRIRVYGCQGKNFPADLDSWSESLDGWTCDSGTLELESERQREGSHCLEVWTPGGGGAATIHRTFDTLVKPQTFVAWAWMPGNLGGGYGQVILFAPDSANYFVANIKTILEGKCILTWGLISLALGPTQMYDANHNPNGIWTTVGNPQWNQITGLKLIMNCVGATSYIFWDGDFGFLNCSYTGTSEDTGSQNAYGLRELTETDEELVSDNECDLRANALLAYLKDPAEYLNLSSTIIDYGTTPLLPADKIHVTLPNENVDSDFRIESVEYRVDAKTQTLEISLELGKVPPLLADYLYGLRATTVTVEKLARTKAGKMAFPWGGGGGSIPEWIWPTFIGPRNDVAAITNFRTKNIAGTSVVDHHFDPSDHEHGLLGRDACRWLEIWTKYLNVSASAKVGQLNIGDIIVITPARILQNVLADAAIITSGQFLLARMPRGDNGKYIRGYGTEFDPMYASIPVADLPDLPASKITSEKFLLARLPNGTSGYVLEGEGGSDPMYVNPNGRYAPAAHSHSHAALTGVLPDQHHAQAHNHAGEALSPNSIAVNTLSVAVSVNCANWVHADILFNNDFRITEAENVNLGHGLVFLNPKGKVVLRLDQDGNIEIFGKLKQQSSKLKSLWQKMKRNAKR